MRAKLLKSFAWGVAISMFACGPEAELPPAGTGGTASGGAGGSPNPSTGGYATGGVIASGGLASGGTTAGGNSPSTGGITTGTGGIANSSGAANGGSSTGGRAMGGAMSGGVGGSGNGGKSFAGSMNGGRASTGGSGAGGASTGGKAGGGTSSTGGKASSGGTSSTGGGTSVNCSGAPLTGGSQHCSSNLSGTANGFNWTIWSSGTGGCMTTYSAGAAFKATWNNSGDFLAREGFQWDETKTYDQYGTIAADYAFTKSGSAGGYSFIGVYGWSNNPLIEYYIVEDWFGSGPPTGGGTLKGTFDLDGGTYKVYTHTQTNQPSIHGNQTFPQYFSVRQTPRQCGHISITEHFKKWGSFGMSLGKMYEAKLLIEAGGGSGSIDFSTATMTAK